MITSFLSGLRDKQSFITDGAMYFLQEHTCCSLVCTALVIILFYKLLRVAIAWPKVGRIQDRYVLVTGCARGFGNNFVRRLDKMGCHVFASCRSEKGVEELRAVTSDKCHVFVMDVTNQDSVRKGLEYVKSVLPPGKGLWGIINNAGIFGSKCGVPEFLDMSEYRAPFDVNVFGLVDVTLTFLPLVKVARGRIINLSSLYGRFSVSLGTPYTMTKYAVEGFSDSLRRSLRSFKCSVHLIEPGIFTTDLTSTETQVGLLNHTWQSLSQEMRDEYGEECFEKIKQFLSDTLGRYYGNHVDHVTDSVVQALFSRYPRARYVVGNDANYAFLPVESLPEWISDWIIDKVGACPVPTVMKQKKQKHE